MKTKKCPKCSQEKLLECFHKNRSSADGLHGYCKPCMNASTSASNRKNRAKCRDRAYRKKYGITLEQYEEMYKKVDGKCQICKTVHPVLCVDHIHNEAKTVRGLLCRECNRGLGSARESIDTLTKAIAYLEKHGK